MLGKPHSGKSTIFCSLLMVMAYGIHESYNIGQSVWSATKPNSRNDPGTSIIKKLLSTYWCSSLDDLVCTPASLQDLSILLTVRNDFILSLHAPWQHCNTIQLEMITHQQTKYSAVTVKRISIVSLLGTFISVYSRRVYIHKDLMVSVTAIYRKTNEIMILIYYI